LAGGGHRQEHEVNPLKPELNLSAQRCVPRFLLGIFIFEELTALRLYKSFGVKGLRNIVFGTAGEQTLMALLSVTALGRTRAG
jgi:hypothetical protein